ncbi:MAG: DUF2666 family protein [Candidatus Micrarchaeota archaeon]
MDEMIFSAAYKDWNYSVKFDLSNALSSDVSYALSFIHEEIENRAFYYSGICCEKIEKFVLEAVPEDVSEGKKISEIITFLESKKPVEWKAFFSSVANKNECIPIAEAKFFNALLVKNGVFATIRPQMINSSIKQLTQERLENQIAFIAKYKNWVTIKKMSTMRNDIKDYEVAGILFGINTTLVKKAFDFMGPDKEIEKRALAITNGKRRLLVNLIDALKQISSSLGDNKIDNAYLLKCVFENIGFVPYANIDTLVSAYPDLKTTKPRGRIAKE